LISRYCAVRELDAAFNTAVFFDTSQTPVD
jgi:hypothetical protein